MKRAAHNSLFICDKITHPGSHGSPAVPPAIVENSESRRNRHGHQPAHLFQPVPPVGAPAGRDDIVAFLARHHLEEGTALPDAPFWNPAQASFLREALAEDSDWAEQVDELALQLTR